MTAHSAVAGVEINAKPSGRQDEILSTEALVSDLQANGTGD